MSTELPNNPAGRVARVLARTQSTGKDLQRTIALDVWAHALGLPAGLRAQALQFAVARGLAMMLEEIEAMEGMLPRAVRIPEATYRPKLDRLRHAMDLSLVFNYWTPHIQQHLDAAESANYLRDTIAHLLGEEEATAAPEVIARIREALQQIRAEAEAEHLEPSLRAFVLELVDALERALRDYQIAGEKAVRHEVEHLLWRWAEFARAHPKAKKTPLYKTVGVALGLMVAGLKGTEAALDAVAKIPAHVREIRQELPKVRAALGLPEQDGAKRLAPPPVMKQIPAVTSPSN